MRTNLLRPNEANHRAELEAVHHRMMLRARTRARYGRWWWQQGRAVSARPAGSGRRAASLPM